MVASSRSARSTQMGKPLLEVQAGVLLQRGVPEGTLEAAQEEVHVEGLALLT